MERLKKYFDFIAIKFPWLLVLSMVMFVSAFYIHRAFSNINLILELVLYGAVFFVILLWSLLNYAVRLKVKSIYKKCDNIDTFIERIRMSKDEKDELAGYLKDFAKDLEEQGETKENATIKAISHFQVKEFNDYQNQKNHILETPIHHYLLGLFVIFVGLFLITLIFNLAFPNIFFLATVNLMMGVYSVLFVSLFFLYRLIDITIKR